MAGRDNVLFYANVASGTAAGTSIPLSLLYGIENVRQGYGTARLKHVRAMYAGLYSSENPVPIEIKNSNWIDSAGVVASIWGEDATLNKDSVCYMRGRDKELKPNTSWQITAELAANTTSAGTIYVLLEIEYSDVPGYNTENTAGSPVIKKCANASVTGAANTPFTIGTFDNLLQGVTYLLSEISIIVAGASTNPNFVLIEGFSNQKGLVRIIPAKASGLADQIEGSVYLYKQTYNIGLIRSTATSAAPVTVRMEMIASQN